MHRFEVEYRMCDIFQIIKCVTLLFFWKNAKVSQFLELCFQSLSFQRPELQHEILSMMFLQLTAAGLNAKLVVVRLLV